MLPSMVSSEVLLSLLRTAMRQWGAFLQTQIAIEQALDARETGGCEIQDYVYKLAPEFVDSPNSLTTDHVEGLQRLFETEQPHCDAAQPQGRDGDYLKN